MTEYESLIQEMNFLQQEVSKLQNEYKDAMSMILKFRGIISDYQKTNVQYRNIVESLGIRNMGMHTHTVQEDGYTDVMNMASNEAQLKRLMHLFGNVGSRQKATTLHLVLDKRITIPSNEYEKLKETLKLMDEVEEKASELQEESETLIDKVRDWMENNTDNELPPPILPDPEEPEEEPTPDDCWEEIFNILDDMEENNRKSWDRG